MPGIIRGTYCLIISCKIDTEANVGKLGKIKFLAGHYAYIGSALNSMDKRIKRHMEKEKKIFWHIDYLTSHKDFKPYGAYIINSANKIECRKAAEIRKDLPFIPGFGSSDCSCSSHLFYSGRKEDGLENLWKLLSRAGFRKYYIDRDLNKNKSIIFNPKNSEEARDKIYNN
jgi:Uri superfamily endonuclease